MDGMGPVTIGLTAGVVTSIARSAVRGGRARHFEILVVAVAAVLGLLAPASPIVIIAGGTILGTLFLGGALSSPHSAGHGGRVGVDPIALFTVFFRASLLSVGGATALPTLRSELVTVGATSDQQIVDALTVGRLSTGPSGLYIVALGYLIAGIVGALVGPAASILVPLLVVPFAEFLQPRFATPRVSGLVRGVALTTTGLVLATTVQLISSTSGSGLPVHVTLAAAGLVVGLQGKRHPILVIAHGAVVGIVLLR